MNEGTTTPNGVIQIKDMEAKVFKALHWFIYADSFPEMEKNIISMGEDEKCVSHSLVHSWFM
jgi:hypothetical protein